MVKVGLVGYGMMGKMHSRCYEALDQARLVALADVEPDRREEAKVTLGCDVYASLDEMLASADVDLVDVCIPTYLHEICVIEAAKAGKHVLCEKPFALSLESADRMIAAADDANVMLMVGHVIRFWPEYQVVKELVDSGKLGRVQWVSARRLGGPATWGWQNWFADPARSGGAILDLHVHDIDYFAWLVGSPGKIQSIGVPNALGGIDSALTLGWDHPGGVKSYAEGTLALSTTYPFTMQLLVACENATIRFDSNDTPPLMVFPNDGAPYAPSVPEVHANVPAEAVGNISALGGYLREIAYFVSCVVSGKKPDIVTPQSAREAIRLCLAARESAQSGETIRL